VRTCAVLDKRYAMNLSFSLPSRLDAPRRARAALIEVEREIPPTLAAKTRLLVSELVSNAIRHGEGRVKVEVETSPERVRATVTDQGQGFVPPAEDDENLAEAGRGLLLVRRMADRWGVSRGSTVVWFEASP